MNARRSIFRDVYEQHFGGRSRIKLYNRCKGSLNFIQRLAELKVLPVHRGCVNSICWNETGEYLLSGSDDQHLVITNGYNYKMMTNYKTSHRANIFSAKFLPNGGDTNIISCSGDGIILYTDLMRKKETCFNQFNCHSGTTYEVITVPGDSHSFLSCGEDGTVRWFDLRVKNKCTKPHCSEDIMITSHRAVTALSVNPVAPYQLAIGCSDSTVRMYDRRRLGTKMTGGDAEGEVNPFCSFTVPNLEDRLYRITSLSFSPEGEEVLVSYSSDHLYLFSVKNNGSLELRTSAQYASSRKQRGESVSPKKPTQRSSPPVRRLRLRGDWSDTGPNARPEREGGRREVAQARPTLQATLMQRMTDVLSRMLNDPATRAALSGGGGDTLEIDEPREPVALTSHAPSTIPVTAQIESNSTSSISVPRLDALSISPLSEIAVATSEIVSVATCDNIPSEERSTNEADVLDLSQVSNLPSAGNDTPDSSPRNPSMLLNVRNETESESGTESDSDVVNFPRSILVVQSCDTQSFNMAADATRSLTSAPETIQQISNIQDQLSTIREGFIERHGSEPAVRLTYYDRGCTSSTISVGVGNEVCRDMHQPDTSTKENTTNAVELLSAEPGPSQEHATAHTNVEFEGEDDFNDSEEENELAMAPGDERFLHPAEEHCVSPNQLTDEDGDFWYEDPSSAPATVRQKYTGHRNARTMIKEAAFWGSDYVMSGSDCGHVFVWDRYSGALVMLLEADRHVVNCVQPHPFLPILATSGIDYDVKLWGPVLKEPSFDSDLADTLMKRNEIMLEETKDTITVPASFMIRMLACLNQIRRGGVRSLGRGRNPRRLQSDEGSSSSN